MRVLASYCTIKYHHTVPYYHNIKQESNESIHMGFV
jgi:hypothetical protein